MEEIKVSVVIPVYNAEDYIGECLDSLIAQTLKEIEIICVNDGSIDDTAVILEEYKMMDNRIKVIHQLNQGAAIARNIGLNIAKGKYLSILDSDDFFAPTMLETMYERCISKDLDIAICHVQFFNQQEKKYEKCNWAIRENLRVKKDVFSGEDMNKYIFQFSNGWAWDKMFKREFIETNQLQFQNTKIFNDAFFVFMALTNAEKMHIIDEILATKRREVSTAISSSKNKNWKEFVKLIDAMESRLKKDDKFELYKQSFTNYALHLPIYLFGSVDNLNKMKMIFYLNKEFFPKMRFGIHNEEFFYNKQEYEKYKQLRIFVRK